MVLDLNKININTVYSKIIKRNNLINIHQLPLIKKIVVTSSFNKEFETNEKLKKSVIDDYLRFTFLKPKFVKAKHSVSTFDIRKGDIVGVKVILNKAKALSFLTKIIFIILPQIRELPKWSKCNFDNEGNFSFGFSEQLIFPEIGFKEEKKTFGMNITIVFSTSNILHSFNLLKMLGFPLKD